MSFGIVFNRKRNGRIERIVAVQIKAHIAFFERLYVEETNDYNAAIHSQDQICFFLGYANDKLKDRKAAISYYEKAVAIYPQCPYAANNLGYLYYREHKYEKAYAILKKCIDERWETDLVFPVTNFARVLYAMGKYNVAREFVKNAPAKVAKAIRDKIEKAPKQDAKKRVSDITVEDAEGNLYIIELKKDSGYDNAYKQTVEYIEWF